MKRQCYKNWPGLDGTSDGKADDAFSNANIQIQLTLGEVLDSVGIKPTEIFIQGIREQKMDDTSWNKLFHKLGFKEG